jgi:hypothetical protein
MAKNRTDCPKLGAVSEIWNITVPSVMRPLSVVYNRYGISTDTREQFLYQVSWIRIQNLQAGQIRNEIRPFHYKKPDPSESLINYRKSEIYHSVSTDHNSACLPHF